MFYKVEEFQVLELGYGINGGGKRQKGTRLGVFEVKTGRLCRKYDAHQIEEANAWAEELHNRVLADPLKLWWHQQAA